MPFSSTQEIQKKPPEEGAVNGTSRGHHIITSKSDIYEYIMHPNMTINQDLNVRKGSEYMTNLKFLAILCHPQP